MRHMQIALKVSETFCIFEQGLEQFGEYGKVLENVGYWNLKPLSVKVGQHKINNVLKLVNDSEQIILQ